MLDAEWKCPDTIAEITRSARARGALQAFIVAVVSWWIATAIVDWLFG